MEEEEGGGGFLNGPLSGGREGGETPVEGKEEEGSGKLFIAYCVCFLCEGQNSRVWGMGAGNKTKQ